MAVFQLMGFQASAEIFGAVRLVSYRDGVLELQGVSLGEAKLILDQLATGNIQAVAFEDLEKGEVPKKEEPKQKEEHPPREGKRKGSKDADKQANPPPGSSSVVTKEEPAPPSESKAPAAEPPKAEQPKPAAPPAPPAPPAPLAEKQGYSLEAACKVAKDWTAMSQPIRYLREQGLKEYPAIEAEILKMREMGALSFFKEADDPAGRIKRAFDRLSLEN